MKYILLVTVFVIVNISAGYAADWQGAQWIWQTNDGPANTWMAFRKEVILTDIPETAIASIGVDSKFWLWINGEMVKFEGGAARGPKPGDTWYEEVDLKPYLKTGTNTIAILAWYWGRETFKGTHVDSKKGGLVFQADLGDISVISDNTWKAKSHPAYDPNSGGGNNRIVPYNVHYNANNSLGDWSSSAWYTQGYDDNAWASATEKGLPSTAPWGNLEKSYVTLTDYGLDNYVSLKSGSSAITLPFTNNTTSTITITAKLPFNKQVTPYLDINCIANKIINISTSNENNHITAKYTSKAGSQQFEAFSWMSGDDVRYEIPAGVTVNALKYRWTGVGNLDGNFECNDAFFQRLWWMGRNTIYVCARDNFMDCPGRERSLWIGDVSDQASYLFYTLDEQGRELLKKAIRITIDFSIDDAVIAGQGPGFVNELPTQSLQFISQAIWQYYLNTGDEETLEYAYSHVKNYLALWGMDYSKNLIRMKACTHEKCWDWCDWDSGKTIDKLPIFNALYYYALNSAKKMANVLDKPQADIDWYNGRIDQIYMGFNNAYWKGEFYSSNTSTFQDDRTNALAIITGLADDSKFESIVNSVLVPNHFCSPHFEWMIEEAMCMAGYHTEALSRMKSRYKQQVNNLNTTTLNEYFTIGEGTDNHAWNAPNTVLSKYIAGVSPVDVGWSKYQIFPHLTQLTSVKQVVPSVKGIITVDINLGNSKYQMDLSSPEGSVAIVGIPKESIVPTEVKVNETVIWQDGDFVDGVTLIAGQGEDDDFIWFELNDGNWSVIASGVVTIQNYVNCTNLSNGEIVNAGTDLVVNAETGITTTNVDLFVNDQLVRSITEAPFTWGLDALVDVALANMGVGNYSLKLEATNHLSEKVESTVTIQCKMAPSQTPYDGIIQVPGKFEAENYDIGIDGVAYHDNDGTNQSGVYRTEGVDVGAGGSGYVIGYMATNEWLEYTINVAEDGNYDLKVSYSSGKPTGGAVIGAEFFDEGKTLIGSFLLAKTTAWSNYQVVSLGSFPLTKGEHVLRINVVNTGFNLDWIELEGDVANGTGDLQTKKISVHPNPNSSGIFNMGKWSKWEVYSIVGKKIKTGEGIQADISKFPNGWYILKTEESVHKILFQ